MNIPLTRLLLLLLFVAAPLLGADERKAAPTVNAAAAPKPKQFVRAEKVAGAKLFVKFLPGTPLPNPFSGRE